MTTEAYKRGMEDFYDKTCHATQPYDAGTEDAIDWSRGYYTARLVCRMKTHVPRLAYAVIDPAWGDLRVMTETISDTPDEAWKKACVSEEVGLYS